MQILWCGTERPLGRSLQPLTTRMWTSTSLLQPRCRSISTSTSQLGALLQVMEVYCSPYNQAANFRPSSSFDSPVSLSPDHLDNSKEFSSSCIQTVKEEIDRSPVGGMEATWSSYGTVPNAPTLSGFRQDYPFPQRPTIPAYNGTLQLHVDPLHQQSNIFIQVGHHPCYPPTPPEPVRTESTAASQPTSTPTYVHPPAGAFPSVEWPVAAPYFVPTHSELSIPSVQGPYAGLSQPAQSGAGANKVCRNCGTTETPLWRRTHDGQFICNACGIYWKTNSCARPVQRPNTKRPPSRQAKTRDASCANCGTSVTSLWRRDQDGQTVCNACGLYYKLHKEHRPIKLKKDHIKTRKRRCRGEELERATTTLPGCHMAGTYSPLQSLGTNHPSYVMMSTATSKDQHSPASDGGVTMATSAQTRPSIQQQQHQSPYSEV